MSFTVGVGSGSSSQSRPPSPPPQISAIHVTQIRHITPVGSASFPPTICATGNELLDLPDADYQRQVSALIIRYENDPKNAPVPALGMKWAKDRVDAIRSWLPEGKEGNGGYYWRVPQGANQCTTKCIGARAEAQGAISPPIPARLRPLSADLDGLTRQAKVARDLGQINSDFYDAVLISVPPRCGKTIPEWLIALLSGKKSLIIVPSDGLRDQCIDDLCKLINFLRKHFRDHPEDMPSYDSVKVVTDKILTAPDDTRLSVRSVHAPEISEARIVVMTWQTLAKVSTREHLIQNWGGVELLITDEAHRTRADVQQDIRQQSFPHQPSFMLTATPDRRDLLVLYAQTVFNRPLWWARYNGYVKNPINLHILDRLVYVDRGDICYVYGDGKLTKIGKRHQVEDRTEGEGEEGAESTDVVSEPDEDDAEDDDENGARSLAGYSDSENSDDGADNSDDHDSDSHDDDDNGSSKRGGRGWKDEPKKRKRASEEQRLPATVRNELVRGPNLRSWLVPAIRNIILKRHRTGTTHVLLVCALNYLQGKEIQKMLKGILKEEEFEGYHLKQCLMVRPNAKGMGASAPQQQPKFFEDQLKQLKKGGIDIVIQVRIFEEGLTFTNFSTCLICYPIQSGAKAYQMSMRIAGTLRFPEDGDLNNMRTNVHHIGVLTAYHPPDLPRSQADVNRWDNVADIFIPSIFPITIRNIRRYDLQNVRIVKTMMAPPSSGGGSSGGGGGSSEGWEIVGFGPENIESSTIDGREARLDQSVPFPVDPVAVSNNISDIRERINAQLDAESEESQAERDGLWDQEGGGASDEEGSDEEERREAQRLLDQAFHQASNVLKRGSRAKGKGQQDGGGKRRRRH
ncbi:hypothetical protein HK104_007027 [Borealophlyctis nickersoniae]|nr:hypothetical protein HK104_007027 [Borealophlyctis nickersoniae]